MPPHPLFSSCTNGTSPPSCLSQSLEMMPCLFVVLEDSVSHLSLSDYRNTHTKRRIFGGGCPICPVLGFATGDPTWRVPHPGSIHLSRSFLGCDSLCSGSVWLPIFVSAVLTGVRVKLITRQWMIQDGQCLTSGLPTHAHAWPHRPIYLCGLKRNL